MSPHEHTFGELNQRDRIKKFLEMGQTLTRLNAWARLGILEAPARISELRAEGHNIKTNMVTVRNRYGHKVSVAEWSMGDTNEK
jgi:hypothetical protein